MMLCVIQSQSWNIYVTCSISMKLTQAPTISVHSLTHCTNAVYFIHLTISKHSLLSQEAKGFKRRTGKFCRHESISKLYWTVQSLGDVVQYATPKRKNLSHSRLLYIYSLQPKIVMKRYHPFSNHKMESGFEPPSNRLINQSIHQSHGLIKSECVSSKTRSTHTHTHTQ